MKKNMWMAGILVALMVSLGAGAAQEKEEVQEKQQEMDVTAMVGGWGAAEDFAMDEEKEEILHKGLEGYQGAKGKTYEPVAYLGSQVVAGINHAILCREKNENGYDSWVIVYLYEDLDREVSVMSMVPLNLGELCSDGLKMEQEESK